MKECSLIESLLGIHPNEYIHLLSEQRFILLEELHKLSEEGLIPKERYMKVSKEISDMAFKLMPDLFPSFRKYPE